EETFFFFLKFSHRVVVGGAAQRFVFFSLSEEDKIVAIAFPERIVSEVSGARTNRVDFGNVFGCRHQSGHRTERSSFEVHVESGYNHTDSRVRQIVANTDDVVVEELSFSNPDDFASLCQNPDGGGGGSGSASNFIL